MKHLLLLALLSLNLMTVGAQQSSIKDILRSKKSSVTDTAFKISTKDGIHQEIPITLISGAKDGPTFTLIAGIHGMEYPTILSLMELRREIDPKKLSGNLIVIPVVNTKPFFKRVPFVNPIDQLNLNRIFPGNPNGSISEVIADFLTREVFSATDILLDLHGGDVGEDLIPFICYYDNQTFTKQTKLVARLSEISGFETIVSYPYILPADKPAMYAFKQAVRQGIPALSIEIGKLGNWQRSEVDISKDAIYRMMEELGIYKNDKVGSATPVKARYNQQAYISVAQQGVFYSTLRAGDHVSKGAEIGYITDIFGNKLQTITAPESGIILYKVGTPPVNKGETLFCIGYTI